MESADVLIVGGGPAGATCAWRLRQHGVSCIVIDQAEFPRLKLCAGWITPQVLEDLALDPTTYPHGFLTFDSTVIHLYGFTFRLHAPQHSIRRVEFDAWLLHRAGARCVTRRVRSITQDNGDYVIDDRFRAPYLVGAGGTRCPVYRSLFREVNPRAKTLQAMALEHEFPYRWRDGDCHLWFFPDGLPGYAWYVPKANGHLNLGIGAMAARLGGNDDGIKGYWAPFLNRLGKAELIDGITPTPKGYSYYLRADVDIGQLDNAFVIGDAAGLATRDMCEGIGPAIRSGLRAADAIALSKPYHLTDITPYSLDGKLATRFLEWRFCGGPRAGA